MVESKPLAPSLQARGAPSPFQSQSRRSHHATRFRKGCSYEDPLEVDERGDVVVTTTRRGLTRLALVASQTGARFQRDAVSHDAMAWLLAPRRLFNGEAPLDACLERSNCLRAIVLHGLARGFDAAPSYIDTLLADDGECGSGRPCPDRQQRSPFANVNEYRGIRLYSAAIVLACNGEILHAFHASVAPSAAVVRERIRARLGAAAARRADIRVGFDPTCPTTIGMVPPAMIDTLTCAARRNLLASFAGLDITVEQRLPS